jgi:hypothetical protein
LKTQAANDRYNAGLSMAAQGVGNLAQLDIAKRMYPDGVDNSNANKGGVSLFSNIFGNKAAKYAKLSDAASKSNLNTLNNIQDKYQYFLKYNPKTNSWY